MKIHTSLLGDPLYKTSESENDGLLLIDNSISSIYSPGISTGGFAEISMALNNPRAQIVATTIDEEGIIETMKLIQQYHVENQVTAKLEDLAQPLPYKNEFFDFIYVRLVLHYLSKADLQHALQELHRILKAGCKIFVVVRSFDWESEIPEKRVDIDTGMTIYPSFDKNGKVIKYNKRNLQTQESITEYLIQAGFKVEYMKELRETIYGGYLRIRPNEKPSTLIELTAIK